MKTNQSSTFLTTLLLPYTHLRDMVVDGDNGKIKCVTRISGNVVPLTDEGTELVEWAFSLMTSAWGAYCTKDGIPSALSVMSLDYYNSQIPENANMPYRNGRILFLSNWQPVNDFLFEVLNDVYPERAEEGIRAGRASPERSRRYVEAAKALAAQIKG